jgi:hypothetical protein
MLPASKIPKIQAASWPSSLHKQQTFLSKRTIRRGKAITKDREGGTKKVGTHENTDEVKNMRMEEIHMKNEVRAGSVSEHPAKAKEYEPICRL